jgi:ATP-binding protein involved in chromosome partitioning
MTLTEATVREALKGVNDPEIGKDLVALNMVGEISIDGPSVQVRIDLTTPACPLKGKIQGDIEEALLAVGAQSVSIDWGVQMASQVHSEQSLVPGVRYVIAVGAGKGGVGKSTVAVNLAAGLSRSGARVGLLDADIYGPSIPTMMGLNEKPQAGADKKILPMQAHGMKVISMGSFVDDEAALVWRGPMLNKALRQFFADVRWGDLDYLVVDLPPGTGDVPLSIAQMVTVGAAVIVTTPQDVAVADVLRAKTMFDTLKIPVAGLIENMAGFTPPGGGEPIPVFGQGGGEKAAKRLNVPLIGELPIDPRMSNQGDEGTPMVLADPQSDIALKLLELAQNVAGRLSVLAMQRSAQDSGGSIQVDRT